MKNIKRLLHRQTVILSNLKMYQVHKWAGNRCSVTEPMSIKDAKAVMRWYAERNQTCELHEVMT